MARRVQDLQHDETAKPRYFIETTGPVDGGLIVLKGNQVLEFVTEHQVVIDSMSSVHTVSEGTSVGYKRVL